MKAEEMELIPIENIPQNETIPKNEPIFELTKTQHLWTLAIYYIAVVLECVAISFGGEVLIFVSRIITLLVLAFVIGTSQNVYHQYLVILPPEYLNGLLLGENSGLIIVGIVFMISAFYNVATISFIILPFLIWCLSKLLPVKCFKEVGKGITFEIQYRIPDARDETFDRSLQLINTFILYFTTFTVFPMMIFETEIYREQSFYDFFIPEQMFVPSLFLLFGIFLTLGTSLAGYIKLTQKQLFVSSIARTIFIIIFLFCNYRPQTRILPVLITNENVYFISLILFALSGGYLAARSEMNDHKIVRMTEPLKDGLFTSMTQSAGTFFGFFFSSIIMTLTDWF
uniref:Major Facilitator Superfamily protein n=1 Tax=Rhabditophanes sp. KR3021 TaxID=114890 RepID=A0AC35TLI8_9BILA